MEWYSKCVVMISVLDVVGRVLHRAEVPDLVFLRDDDQGRRGAGPSSGLHADAAQRPAGCSSARLTVRSRSARYFFT